MVIPILYSQIHDDPILRLQLPVGQAAVDMVPLVLAGLQQPLQSTVTCLQGCPNPNVIPCGYIAQQGNVQLLKLCRLCRATSSSSSAGQPGCHGCLCVCVRPSPSPAPARLGSCRMLRLPARPFLAVLWDVFGRFWMCFRSFGNILGRF